MASSSASTRSTFVRATTPWLDAEQLEDPQVLLGLRLPAFGGRHHEQAGIDRADPGQHVLEEAHVAGHVDERDASAGRQRGVGEAEVDGEPAPLLLVEAVGVGAGQRQDERRLAVVDVAGGGDDVHSVLPASACGQRAGALRRWWSSPGSTVRRSSTVRPSRTRATIGGSKARRTVDVVAGERDPERRDGAARAAPRLPAAPRSAPPPRRDTRGHHAGAPAQLVSRCRGLAPEGHRLAVAAQVGEGDGLERAEHEPAGPQRAGQGMGGAGRHQLGSAGDHAGLRPAEQLVAAERHQAGPGRQRLAGRRLADQPRRWTGLRATGRPRRAAPSRCRRRPGRPASPSWLTPTASVKPSTR